MRKRKTTNQMTVNTRPTAKPMAYCCQWLAISGMKFRELISMRPPANTPTQPTRFMAMASREASKQWTMNSGGAMNRNVNSMGSVTPQKIAVRVMGMSRESSSFFFSGLAVT